MSLIDRIKTDFRRFFALLKRRRQQHDGPNAEGAMSFQGELEIKVIRKQDKQQ